MEAKQKEIIKDGERIGGLSYSLKADGTARVTVVLNSGEHEAAPFSLSLDCDLSNVNPGEIEQALERAQLEAESILQLNKA